MSGTEAVMEVGKAYRVNHMRKGTFVFLCESNDGEFAHGIVLEGTARAAMVYNDRSAGEPLAVRTSFIKTADEIRLMKEPA
jgi:hypothetical protein